MRGIALGLTLLALTVGAQDVGAQEASDYDCTNEPTRVNIPSMPLGDAVARFTDLTGCPVSIDTDQVANTDVTEVPTYPVKGRMTPGRALKTMLWSSPLKSRAIKGGFSIYQN